MYILIDDKIPPAGHYGDTETEFGRVCLRIAHPDFNYMSGETLTPEGGLGHEVK